MIDPRQKVEYIIRMYDSHGCESIHDTGEATMGTLMTRACALSFQKPDTLVRMTLDIAYPKMGK